MLKTTRVIRLTAADERKIDAALAVLARVRKQLPKARPKRRRRVR